MSKEADITYIWYFVYFCRKAGKKQRRTAVAMACACSQSKALTKENASQSCLKHLVRVGKNHCFLLAFITIF
jgi:hypothetical protein